MQKQSMTSAATYKPTNAILYQGRKASLSLNIVVVGCGLGGLAAAYCLGQAGHKVTILESASAIGEVGAGIQLGPNLTRLLIRWGLGPQLEEMAVLPKAISLRRYNDGTRLSWTKWGDSMQKNYGAPYYHIHRADFHKLLFSLAAPHMTLRLKSRVVSTDPTKPSLTLESGEVIYADLIIGADGVKSIIRETVVGGPDKPVHTGDAAYRATISVDDMIHDPELMTLVDETEMTGWIGPGRHIMGYCIRGKKEYNMVMLHPDSGAQESYTAMGSVEKMRADFAGWEPRLQKLLALVPSTMVWPLMDRAPLDTWVHKEGKIALLGDACHPMLPYRAQGSAMAVEDAAVLGNLFSHLTTRKQIAPLLHAYQSLRYARATETQAASRLNQRIFHLDDGPEQEERDVAMLAAMEIALREARGEGHDDGFLGTEGNPDMWADKSKNLTQFGYDADAEADKWWMEKGEMTVGDLGVSARM